MMELKLEDILNYVKSELFKLRGIKPHRVVKMKALLKTMKEKTVYVVGLGYVGSPLPKALVIENKSV